MAHIDIVEGKCFGPFNGRIVSKMKSPDKMHFLVSVVSLIIHVATAYYSTCTV